MHILELNYHILLILSDFIALDLGALIVVFPGVHHIDPAFVLKGGVLKPRVEETVFLTLGNGRLVVRFKYFGLFLYREELLI